MVEVGNSEAAIVVFAVGDALGDALVRPGRVVMHLVFSLWGSGTRFSVSCGQLGSDVVHVGESAEDLFPVDPVLGEVDRLGWAGRCLGWGEVAEGAVAPCCSASGTRSAPGAGAAR